MSKFSPVDVDITGADALLIFLDGSSCNVGDILYHEENKAKAQLLAAAYSSYRTHCGENAVQCAEDDLLGECLDILRAVHHKMWGENNYRNERWKRIDAILEKLKLKR